MARLYWVTTRLSFVLLAATVLTCLIWGLPLGFLPGFLLFVTIGFNYFAWKRGGHSILKKALYDSIPMGTLFTDIYPQTAFLSSPEERTVDLEDVLVASYIRLGHEFLLTLTTDGLNPSDDATPDPIQLSIDGGENPLAAERAADEYEFLLTRWQENQTSLLLLQAPGKVTVLAENPSVFLPLGERSPSVGF